MSNKITKLIEKLHRGQKGMTGLETAIILIAVVTVASVLAYSVLSAGIFSAERGKATVYGGLAQASATIQVKGTVVGDSNSANTSLDYVHLFVSLTIPDESVDVTSLAISVSSAANQSIISNEPWNDVAPTAGNWQYRKVPGSAERGSVINMEGDELFEIVIDTSSFDTLGSHEWFIIEIVPPTGATLTIKRKLPAILKTKMNLN